MTENVMALPQTVGFKAETVYEEGVWCACTVEEVNDVTRSFPLTAGMRSGIAASVIHERSGIEHCLIGKEGEETFSFSEQCLRFKKTDFYFKISPKLM